MVTHMNRLETAARLAMADFSDSAPAPTSIGTGLSQITKVTIALCVVAASGIVLGGIL